MKNILFTLCLLFTVSVAFSQIKVITSGNVGVGIDAPTEKLEVDGNFKLVNAGNDATFRTSSSNLFIEKDKAMGTTLIDISPRPGDGTSNAKFRFFRTTNTTGNAAFDVHVGNNTSAVNTSFSGNGDSFINRLSGNVGIGTNAPTQKLSVDGTAGKPGGGDWATFSDKRLKKDVKEYTEGLKEILQINPVLFKYNGKAGMTDTKTEYVGVIAQEMQDVSPRTIQEVVYQEVLVQGEDENEVVTKGPEERYLQYDGTAITYMLVNAIQEQQEIIQAQNAKIAELTETMSALAEVITSNPTGETTINTEVELTYYDLASVEQNNPNPFNGYTTIDYVIPSNANNASIKFFDMNGKLIKTQQLDHTGKGQVTLRAEDIPAGNYSYSLVVDGNQVDTKRMVLAK